ncbi:hypothetical protein [Clostridium kluyveri]|nr:hypothetical protein [Clostridium kluyveri]
MNKRRVLSIVLTFALAITALGTNMSLSTVRAIWRSNENKWF